MERKKMKNLIKKILKEGDFDWASEGTDEGDGNFFISAIGKLEKMLELRKSVEEDLKNIKNPIIKKLGIDKDWGGEPLPTIQNQILKLKKILEMQTTGLGKIDWKNIVVSKEVGQDWVGKNRQLGDYIDRMGSEFNLKPNIKQNHPYKVDPKELGEEYISGNLIWVTDVNPSNNILEYVYYDQNDGYDTDIRLSDVREIGDDYLRFGQ